MMLLLSLLAGPALLPPAELQALVEGFAGAPAVVDPRLILPACPAPALGWAAVGSVEVNCAAPAWRIFVPAGRGAVAGGQPLAAAVPQNAVLIGAPPIGAALPVAEARPAPAIRRGDRVMLEAGGSGFIVAVEATATADARDGRVALRTGGGRALTGVIGGDGHVRLTGLNLVSTGR